MRARVMVHVLVAFAAGCSCGPPPSVPLASGTEDAAGGAPGAESDGPSGGSDGGGAAGADGPAHAPPPAPEETAFREILVALASGSARAVRDFVPGGGLLILRSYVCRKPLYGVGTCHDERTDAERRRVDDALLAPWQEALRRAAEARSTFDLAAVAVQCAPTDGGRNACSTDLWFGRSACQAELQARVSAVLQDAGNRWVLVELGYNEEILICE